MKHLQQRALAGAIAPDDPQHLALPHLEIDVAQRPEPFGVRASPNPVRSTWCRSPRRTAPLSASPIVDIGSTNANAIALGQASCARSRGRSSSLRRCQRTSARSAGSTAVRRPASSAVDRMDIGKQRPGGACPSNAHRNPSTTPAMGLSPYTACHRSGTSELG